MVPLATALRDVQYAYATAMGRTTGSEPGPVSTYLMFVNAGYGPIPAAR